MTSCKILDAHYPSSDNAGSDLNAKLEKLKIVTLQGGTYKEKDCVVPGIQEPLGFNAGCSG